MKNINNHILLLYHVALSESLKNLVFHYKVIISDFDLENFCLVLTPNIGPTITICEQKCNKKLLISCTNKLEIY